MRFRTWGHATSNSRATTYAAAASPCWEKIWAIAIRARCCMTRPAERCVSNACRAAGSTSWPSKCATCARPAGVPLRSNRSKGTTRMAMELQVNTRRRIRVLVVDDSALVRSLLTRILGEDRDIEVVGAAADAFVARDKIKALRPDVLTLDVQMPRMDGLQFLRNLMRLRPMPVVMCSSLTAHGAEVTLAALELGAVDFITKPQIDLEHELSAYAGELIEKVKAAATARVRPLVDEADPVSGPSSTPTAGQARRPPGTRGSASQTSDHIIAIGASTGGTEAIRQVLSRLPADCPGVVIAQHIPRAFSQQFATRMDGCSALSVQEASDGALIQPGRAYIAPGDRHLLVERDGSHYRCRLRDEAPINRHRPSIDLLFTSMAREL